MNGAFSLGHPSDLTPDEYDVLMRFLRDVAKEMKGEGADDGIEIDMDSPEGRALLGLT